jgi:hypothetical protein
MGWDAGLNRKLAHPLAVRQMSRSGGIIRTRILKNDDVLDDLQIVTRLAQTKARLDRLEMDIERDPVSRLERPDITAELDFLETSIKLDILQITAELEEAPYSEDFFDEIMDSGTEEPVSA